MVTELENEKIFLVKCSDWSATVESEDHYEACTAVLQHMMEKYGGALRLSCVMISSDIGVLSSTPEDLEATMFHATSKILANAGYHNISKSMKEIFDT